MELVVATNNRHKLEELSPLFDLHVLRAAGDAGIDFGHEELETTFSGNSLAKARALWREIRKPVLADDSGLCVDALGGAPGVMSARYGSVGGIDLSSPERNALLLGAMRGIRERGCRFVCCMTLMIDEDRFFVVQETCEGVLLEEGRGGGGFGYDPIVFLPAIGMSVAELPRDLKNKLSHRGRAAARILAVMRTL
ncbi:MAG: non-canonical purine NTP pyrophosphatase [Spirochaetes bacterium]|nr:non-canonical purine NTP pyrophosphatase [Spirochaetota bacterium]